MSWRAKWSSPATKPGHEIVNTFGTAVLQPDRALDRQKLRTIIFDDPDARKKLESIIHPQVRALAEKSIREHAAAGYAVIVYEVPLLFEGNLQEWLRPVILVACDVETQRKRLQSRDQSQRGDAQKHIAAQMSLEEKRELADYVIENNGSLEDLERQVASGFGKNQSYLTRS